MNKVALVVGANGVIGSRLIDQLVNEGHWEVIGLSRRDNPDTDTTKYISVDLLDRKSIGSKLAGLTHVTHIFFAGYVDMPSWAELVEPNLLMLKNVVDYIESIAPSLQHVSLMQGYKVYGAHLGVFKTPAKESDPKHMPPEFNVAQQDYLEGKQLGKSWTWSALRPSVVGGLGIGNPMNLALLIALYATISKELGIPLRFPGKPGAYNSLIEMTDATLLANATIWAATTDGAANQALNINNGDLFRWNDMWPKIAQYFGMPVADPLQMNLSDVMKDKDSVWESIKEKYGLQDINYDTITSWSFGDFVFSWDYDFFADSSKSRRLGFSEYKETESMFFEIFDDLRSSKIIP